MDSPGPVRGATSVDTLVWASLAAISAFLCTSRVLSPQYLLWLLPTAIAGLAVVGPTRRSLARWTGALVAAALLSHALYPWLYAPLVHVHRDGGAVALGVLVVRNLLLVALLVHACRTALRLSARA